MKKRSNTSLVLCVLLILLAAIMISCNSGDQAPLPTNTQPKPTETEAPKATDPIIQAPVHTDKDTDDKTDDNHTHTWGAWNIIKAPSCTENGVKAASCICGEQINETITASHSYGDWITAKQPTCAEKGEKHKICSVCKDKQIEYIDKTTQHGALDIFIKKKVTCEEDGLEIQCCSVCSEVISSSTIPHTGHIESKWITDPAPTCDKDGLKFKKCSVCSTVLESYTLDHTGHSEGDWITEAPSFNIDGRQYKTCQTCGDVLNEIVLPAHVNTLKYYIDIPDYGYNEFDEEYIDLGQSSYMNVVKDTTFAEYSNYRSLLESKGFVLYTTNTIGSNRFATYVTKTQIVNVMLLKYDYDESNKNDYPKATSKDHYETRVIVDDRDVFDLPGLAEDNVYSADSNITPSLSLLSDDQMSWPGRMGFLYQLSDGSFFIIDGGYWAGGRDTSETGRNKDPMSKASMAKTIINVLEKFAPDPDNIVIAGWLFTHIHSDHTGAFYDMSRIKEFRDKVTIEKVIYNMPSSSEMAGQDVASDNLDGMSDWEEIFNIALNNFAPKSIIKAHTGQKFFIRDLSFDVYTTQDIILYSTMVENGKNLESITWHNDVSVITMMQFHGRKLLFLGDTHEKASKYTTNPLFRNQLQADILQVAHHGYGDTRADLLNMYIDPQMVIWPASRGHCVGSNPGYVDNRATYYYKDGIVYDEAGNEAVDSNPNYIENGVHYGYDSTTGLAGVAAVKFNSMFIEEGITQVYPLTNCIATITNFETLTEYTCWDARPNT